MSVFPDIKPILSLNFLQQLNPAHPAYSFSRASIGSYYDSNGILRYARSGVPRSDHDPLTGICKGLLVEPSVTFLDTYSEQFDNAAWMKTRATITPNAAIAPDGTMTADKLVEDTTAANSHGVGVSISSTSSTVFFGAYLKASERSMAFINAYTGAPSGVQAVFNLTAKSYSSLAPAVGGTGSTGLAAGVTDCGNGWLFCWVSCTATAGTFITGFVQIYNGDLAYTGDGTSGLYIWGAKVYAGTGPTSYLPTTTAGVTRAADVCSVDLTKLTRNGSPLWTGNEWTVLIDFEMTGFNTSINTRILSIGSDSLNEFRPVISASTGRVTAASVAYGALEINYELSTKKIGASRCRAIFCMDKNSFNGAVNGELGVAKTLFHIPVSTKLILMDSFSGMTRGCGNIRQIMLWNRRIDDAYLPSLSTI